MARYGKKASKKVERAMHKRKEGSLRSGGPGKKVTSRKQAIAIGLSEARKEGGKVPSKRGSSGGGRAGASGRKKSSSRASSGSGSRKKSSSRKGSTSSRGSSSSRSGGGGRKKKEGLLSRIIHTIV